MRKAYGVGHGLKNIIAANVNEFPEKLFNIRGDLEDLIGANYVHAVDHHNSDFDVDEHIDPEQFDDKVYNHADQIVDVLSEVESEDEMEELLGMMGVKDYIDYISVLFPMIKQKVRNQIEYDLDIKKFLNLESVQRSLRSI